MRYEKFEDWMIGKRVKWLETHGTITRPYRVPDNDAFYAIWDDDMEESWIYIHEVEFVDDPSKEMILEMNGKRYRLVEIKEQK